MIPAIDAVCNLWTREINQTRPQALEDQVRYFWRSYAKVSDDLYQGETVEKILAKMDGARIERAFMIAAELGIWRVPYEKIQEAVSEHPDRFYGLAGINPEEGMPGVRRLEKAVKEYGFIGAHVYPHWFKTPPNDRIYYPFYAKCVELDVPIEIQIGHAAQTYLPSVAHPMTLDDVAIYFPELKIIGIHIGWPWVEHALAVALKHPNVHLCCDAHAPKYWDEKFIRFIKTRGRNKVIFGTDYPIIDFKRARDEIEALGFSPEVQNKFFRENATRVFKLPETQTQA